MRRIQEKGEGVREGGYHHKQGSDDGRWPSVLGNGGRVGVSRGEVVARLESDRRAQWGREVRGTLSGI
jgi:hypothetical protein